MEHISSFLVCADSVNILGENHDQTCSGSHPAFYPVGTGDSYSRGKMTGYEADHSPPASAEFRNTWSYTSKSPIYLHGTVLNYA